MPEKLVVYTAIFGDYEGLVPQCKVKGVDFICFTDTKRRAVYPWKIQNISTNQTNPTRAAREIKILPHNYLSAYDQSVWVDANFLLRNQCISFIKEKLKDADLWVFDHNQTKTDPWNCIYQEEVELRKMYEERGKIRDDLNLMKKQIDRYRAEGYPANNGLISSGVLLRNHHESNVIELMEKWWDEIVKGSKRDQLSFNYSAWKLGYEPSVIQGDIRNHKYFYMLSQHKKSYITKWLKYKLGLSRKQF